uniref:Uncharacterized protein n=1 Tax=Anguilla anguilla TaxID=7936 RepID=A0A0E9PMA8_ANGAN
MVPSIMALRPGSEAAKCPYTITLFTPCLTDGVMVPCDGRYYCEMLYLLYIRLNGTCCCY